jgi:hypothetical protein
MDQPKPPRPTAAVVLARFSIEAGPGAPGRYMIAFDASGAPTNPVRQSATILPFRRP